ncbi:class I SAM-dependent methyltransferase [Allonocardiopsis opalescens]|uniref:Methyltransferase family protein n=1 Tax=Allonocardiopsis opalescens TaxID=1144618 RepID=A0A2T0QEV9_9ACTN|nr:class I SAM-dependent methyltransferase [Allonocardiopsis opalescens]PRY02435.1 methyltransferase family protein [Allonocardiopsis opalescens]
MSVDAGATDHVGVNRRYWDEEMAAVFGPLARDQWSAEPRWGHWAVPESRLSMIPADIAGMDAIELGCGTGYVSSWLARAGARPVGLDISARQLATARAMQEEFGVRFPLVLASAERTPFADGSFDLVISEFGASLWCDPRVWIAEAARLLAPGGRLVFLRHSPLFALCVPSEGAASAALRRPQFGLHRLDYGDSVEFTLPHGEMLRLLRSHGFTVEDLIEIQAPADTDRDYDYVSAAWARDWPSEEIWKARLAG